MKLFRNFRGRVEKFFFLSWGMEIWKFHFWSHYLLAIKNPQHEMVKKLYVSTHKSISKSCLCTEGPKPIKSLKMQLKWERTVSSQGECVLKMSYTCACLSLVLIDGKSKLWERLLHLKQIIVFLTTDRSVGLVWGALEVQG